MNKFEKELKKQGFLLEEGIWTLHLYDDVESLSYNDTALRIEYNVESDDLYLMTLQPSISRIESFKLIKINSPKQLKKLIEAIRGYN